MHNTARRQITWKPGRGLSPEAYHSDILILDFLASRLRETNSYLSHTVYGILLQRPELRQSDDYWLRAHSGGSLPEFQSWFFCLLAFFFFSVCLFPSSCFIYFSLWKILEHKSMMFLTEKIYASFYQSPGKFKIWDHLDSFLLLNPRQWSSLFAPGLKSID